MLKKRLVACLLIRNGLLVQSIGFKRYLPVGRPNIPIEFIARWDVDEIVLLDMSASTENRTLDKGLLEKVSQSCFVPLTVGGGVMTVNDVRKLIASGADKVAVNTHAVARPQLITEIANVFGTQCVVVSIDCRKEESGNYQVYSQCGNRPTGMNVESWAKQVQKLGAGEIFLNSIDRDGSKSGYDVDLISRVSASVSIPVIACGGVGNYKDFVPGILAGGSAVAAANIFHHIEHSTIVAKAHLLSSGIDVRLDGDATYIGREFEDNGRIVSLTDEMLADVEFKRGLKDFI